MSADWWTEDRRGQLIGYGIRWGSHLAHITKITDSGPGANSVSALCGGIQGVCHVNSGLDLEDQAECEDWKLQDVRFPMNCPIETAITEPRRQALVCPRCRAKYEKRTAK